MDYKTASKVKVGDYVMPKYMKEPENLRVVEIIPHKYRSVVTKGRILFVLENGDKEFHTDVNKPCLFDSEKGRFDTATGKWVQEPEGRDIEDDES